MPSKKLKKQNGFLPQRLLLCPPSGFAPKIKTKLVSKGLCEPETYEPPQMLLEIPARPFCKQKQGRNQFFFRGSL